MRLKWHTLAVAGSLGIFASFQPLLADDNPPEIQKSTGDPASIISQISPRAAARRSAANPAAQDKNDNQDLSQELLRQAMVELDAKRFDTARRLARRAAALGVASGSIQPEQLLQEIDRHERGAKVVVQQASPVAPDTRTQLKSRAIELLDRGILALDQKRYDDAENCAQMAAQIHVAWDRYDYKPENLLEDVRREHSAGSASPSRPIADLAYDPRPTTAAASAQPSEWSQRTNPPAYSPTPAAFAAPAQPVSTAATASGGRTTAQAVLEQAMDDLRAGRDELARLRIEQALNSLAGSPQSSPVASFAGYSAAANRPAGLTPGGLVPATPGYTPSTATATFFPVRRDQPNVAPVAASASDVALKPMHDPFLGDDATTTDKQSAGAQAMRESMPMGATINPVYVSRSSLPVLTDTPVQRIGYDTPAAAASPRMQAAADTQALNPQLSWLEKMSVPIPPQGAMPSAQAYAGQQTAPQPYAGQPYPPVPQPRGFNTAPIAQPVSGDVQWQPGRMATPSGTDPTAGNSPDQPKPGFFQKMWGAISGE